MGMMVEMQLFMVITVAPASRIMPRSTWVSRNALATNSRRVSKVTPFLPR